MVVDKRRKKRRLWFFVSQPTLASAQRPLGYWIIQEPAGLQPRAHASANMTTNNPQFAWQNWCDVVKGERE
jgi:hypothetical protein